MKELRKLMKLFNSKKDITLLSISFAYFLWAIFDDMFIHNSFLDMTFRAVFLGMACYCLNNKSIKTTLSVWGVPIIGQTVFHIVIMLIFWGPRTTPLLIKASSSLVFILIVFGVLLALKYLFSKVNLSIKVDIISVLVLVALIALFMLFRERCIYITVYESMLVFIVHYAIGILLSYFAFYKIFESSKIKGLNREIN